MSSAESPRPELDGKLLVVAVRQEIAFRVRDRRLFCPRCGATSQPPSDICYGCDGGRLTDPLRPAPTLPQLTAKVLGREAPKA